MALKKDENSRDLVLLNHHLIGSEIYDEGMLVENFWLNTRTGTVYRQENLRKCKEDFIVFEKQLHAWKTFLGQIKHNPDMSAIRYYMFDNWGPDKFLVFLGILRYNGITNFIVWRVKKEQAIQFCDDGTEAMFLFHYHDWIRYESNSPAKQ